MEGLVPLAPKVRTVFLKNDLLALKGKEHCVGRG